MKVFFQWLWEQPQTLIGWSMTKFIKGYKTFIADRVIHNMVYRKFGVSLGRYILLPEEYHPDGEKHEYGHCLQSSKFGPLYLPIVGLWSFIRATYCLFAYHRGDPYDKLSAWYYGHWPENQADRLGGVFREKAS